MDMQIPIMSLAIHLIIKEMTFKIGSEVFEFLHYKQKFNSFLCIILVYRPN